MSNIVNINDYRDFHYIKKTKVINEDLVDCACCDDQIDPKDKDTLFLKESGDYFCESCAEDHDYCVGCSGFFDRDDLNYSREEGMEDCIDLYCHDCI